MFLIYTHHRKCSIYHTLLNPFNVIVCFVARQFIWQLGKIDTNVQSRQGNVCRLKNDENIMSIHVNISYLESIVERWFETLCTGRIVHTEYSDRIVQTE